MKLLLKIMSIAMAVYSAQACRTGSCNAFCAGEIKDPTKKLTFYSMDSLDAFNQNFYGDEQFCYLHDGKCIYDVDCCEAAEVEICAVPEPGASGFPQTFRNFCELNEFNCDNPDNEYVYYHDECCNELDEVNPSDDECDCLDCSDEPWQPVCAYPCYSDGAQPVSFSNACWLKKFNCEVPDYQFLYWHENICYTDEYYETCDGC